MQYKKRLKYKFRWVAVISQSSTFDHVFVLYIFFYLKTVAGIRIRKGYRNLKIKISFLVLTKLVNPATTLLFLLFILIYMD